MSSDEEGTTSHEMASKDVKTKAGRRYSQHWSLSLHELVLFQKQHGHCLVPIDYPENLGLARWVKRQRYQYSLFKQEKPCSLNGARIKLLDAIGFVWDSHKVQWENKFKNLLKYKEETGHCDVPSTDSKNRQLSTWVIRQRVQYRLFQSCKPATINQDQIDALEQIGFKWNLGAGCKTKRKWLESQSLSPMQLLAEAAQIQQKEKKTRRKVRA
mmetsp:Transcript_23533/g.34729  ORF Transcript_23533/g.34729 Transcript_23533/m.34729 type:complete len:213 (-) Transcript_23533:59-697(-)|eukprot:CAMPEP_0194200526 /NCGR_PEP_ID=MMETSP0156-20130528/1094_1 /TAXON_ID=33649 /ORGANISM="Thalassionema nitzschioides, Strain L26-B" /LENGTH=212 /DNA_ID=CAMNT_0038925533 /DNA_START=90 /DNA_END=728 /DNA_ORIENTATION=+